jgi:hypothetical protein
MSTIDITAMRAYLSRSITSLNQNKLNGLLAEVDLRSHLRNLGFGDCVSRGGWIARKVGAGEFAHKTAVFFPEIIIPGRHYPKTRPLPQPDVGLHTICATFHQTGIAAYFCTASIGNTNNGDSVTWTAIQLGLPTAQKYRPFPKTVSKLFSKRTRKQNYLHYKTNSELIPENAVAEEFSKENIRVAFQTPYMAEVSDIDGIFWGQQFTYPLEIKEKTVAIDNRIGPYFGLDTGPFVKLAYYAANRGNLNSLFIVREIDNVKTRNLVNWWFITFEDLAKFASWVPRPGGLGMSGGVSSVVCIPKSEFRPLTKANLKKL